MGLHFRHWSAIRSDEHRLPAHLPRMQPLDGTYSASEFNTTLPKHHKGYDTVGYKHFSLDRNPQSDQRFASNIIPDRGNDKGYYSDRTYESPITYPATGIINRDL